MDPATEPTGLAVDRASPDPMPMQCKPDGICWGVAFAVSLTHVATSQRAVKTTNPPRRLTSGDQEILHSGVDDFLALTAPVQVTLRIRNISILPSLTSAKYALDGWNGRSWERLHCR